MDSSDVPILSIVVPVGSMSWERLGLLKWGQTAVAMKIQVIVILDTSCNQSKEFCENLEELSAQIGFELYSFDAAGPGAARNYGIAKSKGVWIAFWDADDIGSPESALKAILNSNNDSTMIVSIYSKIDSQGNQYFYPNCANSDEFLEQMLAAELGIWRIYFKLGSVGTVKFPPLRMGEDLIFLVRLLIYTTQKIEYSNLETYCYFFGQSSQLTQSKIHQRQILDTWTILKNLELSNNPHLFKLLLKMRFRNGISVISILKFRGVVISFKSLAQDFIANPAEIVKFVKFISCSKWVRSA